MIKIQKELVSIIVLSYNSEEFIEETLESILNQTYKNIEIIIADDSSKDGSVEKAKKYLLKNGFKRFKLSVTDGNSGTSVNCNKALENSKGEYIKLIAADDILDKNCIKKNIDFMKKNKNKVTYSKMITFVKEDGKQKIIEENNVHEYDLKLNEMTATEQYYKMSFRNFIPAPSVFLKREVILKIGGFDESYRLMEDYPMWIKILKAEEKIFFMDEETVWYRKHNNSLSNSTQYLINENLFKDLKKLVDDEIIPDLKNKKKPMYVYHKKVEILRTKLIILSGNKSGLKAKAIKLINLIDPLWIKDKMKLN